MKYLQIPGTDLEASVICLGGGPLGISLDQDQSFALLDMYIDSGGNFIDTANVYGKWLEEGKNVSELTLGSWLQKRGNRESVLIGTKGAHPHLEAMDEPRLSSEEIEKDLNESLQALKTDYIDMYWLHRDDENRPVGEIMETLNELAHVGKIRYFGCSNWRVERISRAQEYADSHNLQPFSGNQMMWSYAIPNQKAIEDDTLVLMDKQGKHFHKETQLAAIPYSSQAQGFFTKLKKCHGDIDKLDDRRRQKYFNPENIKRYHRALKLAKDLSRSISEIALSYLISQPFSVIPIAGFSNTDQLQESMKAGDLVLDDNMVEFLEKGDVQI